MSEFIKKQRYGQRSKNVQWLYECPDCGALAPMTPDEAKNRRRPCGQAVVEKTLNGRILHVLEILKKSGVPAISIPGASWLSLSRPHKSYWRLLQALSRAGANMNFIFGRSCSIFEAPENIESCCNYFLANRPPRKLGSGLHQKQIDGVCTICNKPGLIYRRSGTCSKKCYLKKYHRDNPEKIAEIRKRFFEKHPDYYKNIKPAADTA